MIFFFKKKPIVLHCVTDRPELLELAPVQRASRFVPDWWKQLPSSIRSKENNLHDLSTLKNCVGFKDYFSRGLIIPLWSDLRLQIGEEGTDFYRYQFSDCRSVIDDHPPHQHGNHFSQTEYQHVKIVSPWSFFCNEEVQFINVSPTWTFLRFTTITVLNGVVNYKYQASTNINMFIKRTATQQEITIPHLEPILHVIPLSERPLKLIVSDDQKLLQKRNTHLHKTSFVNKYTVNKNAIKFFQRRDK